MFISHGSNDNDVISAIDRAFEGLDVKPFLVERHITKSPPTKKIVQAVKDSDALFAFFTSNSSKGNTRDWIVFELGVAFSQGKPVHAWKERRKPSLNIPRLLDQVTTYRDFDPTPQGILRLMGEIKETAKKHIVSFESRSIC